MFILVGSALAPGKVVVGAANPVAKIQRCKFFFLPSPSHQHFAPALRDPCLQQVLDEPKAGARGPGHLSGCNDRAGRRPSICSWRARNSCVIQAGRLDAHPKAADYAMLVLPAQHAAKLSAAFYGWCMLLRWSGNLSAVCRKTPCYGSTLRPWLAL